jgi:hypothetical protein
MGSGVLRLGDSRERGYVWRPGRAFLPPVDVFVAEHVAPLMKPGRLLPVSPHAKDLYQRGDKAYPKNVLEEHVARLCDQHARVYPAMGAAGRLNYTVLTQPCRLSLPVSGEAASPLRWNFYVPVPDEKIGAWIELLGESGFFESGSVYLEAFEKLTQHFSRVGAAWVAEEDTVKKAALHKHLEEVARHIDEGQTACADRALDAFDRIYESALLFSLDGMPEEMRVKQLLKLGIAWRTDALLQTFYHPFFGDESVEAALYMRTQLGGLLGMPVLGADMCFSAIGEKGCLYSLPRVLEQVFEVWSTRTLEDGSVKDGVQQMAHFIALWPPWQEHVRTLAVLKDTHPAEAERRWKSMVGSLEGFEPFCAAYESSVMGDVEAVSQLGVLYASLAYAALFCHGYARNHVQSVAKQKKLSSKDFSRYVLSHNPTSLSVPVPKLFLEDDWLHFSQQLRTGISSYDLERALDTSLAFSPEDVCYTYSNTAQKGVAESILVYPGYSFAEKLRLILSLVKKGHNPWEISGSVSSLMLLSSYATYESDFEGLLLFLKDTDVQGFMNKNPYMTKDVCRGFRDIACVLPEDSDVLAYRISFLDSLLKMPVYKPFLAEKKEYAIYGLVSAFEHVPYLVTVLQSAVQSEILMAHMCMAMHPDLFDEDVEKNLWQRVRENLSAEERLRVPEHMPTSLTADETAHPETVPSAHSVWRLLASLGSDAEPVPVAVFAPLVMQDTVASVALKELCCDTWLEKTVSPYGEETAIPYACYRRVSHAIKEGAPLLPVLESVLAELQAT